MKRPLPSHYGSRYLSNLTSEEIFRRLIAFDTTSSKSNLELVDFVCDLLDRSASEIIRDASEDRQKVNLAIRIGPEVESERNGLVLSGHMDTVPAVEPSWSTDPFELHDAGDRWVARGSSDMKGFLALAIDLAGRIDADTLHAPLVLLFTYDEEVGTLGAKHWRDHRGSVALPRSVIIGEPTELQVVHMHKGHLKLRIRVHGVSAHSGYPHLGVNAIERAGAVIEALSDLRVELENERTGDSDFFEPVPWVPLNLGEIRGGTAINIVPDLCEIAVGLRILPGLDSATFLDRIEERLRIAISDPDAVDVAVINESPPMKLDESASVARALATITGQTDTRAVSFATDAGWFQMLGLDCALFGPGSIEVAHRPNEFIDKKQFFRAAEVLDQVVQRFCIQGDV